MEINRETVNQWLEKYHRRPSWLAEKCSVTVQAVSNWLREKNPRQISAPAQITIHSLMEEDRLSELAKPPHVMVLEFDDDEYANIEKAALQTPETVRKWAVRKLNEAATIDVEAVAAQIAASEKSESSSTSGSRGGEGPSAHQQKVG